MAKLIYAPRDGERQEWEFDADDLTGDQVILLEDTLDLTFEEWSERLNKGSMKAMLALVWIFRRETDKDLSWTDAKKIRLSALSVELDEESEKKAPKSRRAAGSPTSS